MAILPEAFIIIKLNNDLFSQYLHHIFNECIDTTLFRNTDIIPVNKTNDKH